MSRWWHWVSPTPHDSQREYNRFTSCCFTQIRRYFSHISASAKSINVMTENALVHDAFYTEQLLMTKVSISGNRQFKSKLMVFHITKAIWNCPYTIWLYSFDGGINLFRDPWKCSQVHVRIHGSARVSSFGSVEVLACRCSDPWKCSRVFVRIPRSARESLFGSVEVFASRRSS